MRTAACAHEEHTTDIHRVRAIEIFRRRVFDGADVGDAGVVDEDVEAPEGVVDLVERPRDGVGIRDIAKPGGRVAAVRADGVDRCIRAVVPVERDAACALTGQQRRDSRADPGSGTSDGGDFVVESNILKPTRRRPPVSW